MRFGCFVPQGWRLDLVGVAPGSQWSAIVASARSIEAAGFESLWVNDHFHTVPVPTQEPTFEAWSVMSALAVATDTVRLGQMCTCVSYRPPAYLAKMAATIDVVAGGRLEMGIGAGWYEHEYTGYGYEFPAPATRISMLDEAVEIMRRMWTEDTVNFEGRHYRLKGAINRPRPLQDPHIPIWIAGGGEQLTLRVAARHANYTNFAESIDAFVHKSAILRGHCEDVGRDFSDIVRSTNFPVVCAESDREVKDRLNWIEDRLAAFADPKEAARRRSSFERLSGTPEQLVERLEPWAAAGLGYAILYFAEIAQDTSGVELFASQVMPELGRERT